MKIWYNSQPPLTCEGDWRRSPDQMLWEKYSLPLGNGYLGACVFGYSETERIQITENSLAHPYVKQPKPGTWNCGLNNFAELFFDFAHTGVENYVRELSLDNATARVSYTYGGVRYIREYFTSHPDGVLVIRFSSDTKGAVSFTARPEIPYVDDWCAIEGDGYAKSGKVTAKDDTLYLCGMMSYYEVKYEGQLKIINNGGTLTTDTNTITVTGADEVVAIFACGTNYKMESRVFTEPEPKKKLAPYEHPHERVSTMIGAAAKKSYNELRDAHLADYKGLFGRVSIYLGETMPDVPTDELLERYKSGKESRYLEALLCQFGRYLLICSSRRGCLPAHLQGIWNYYRSSPWSCGYWHNINVQMNYWPSCIANLSEMFLSYSDYNQAYMAAAKENADRFVTSNYPDKLGEPGTNGWIIGTGAWPYRIEGFNGISHSGPGTGAFTSLLFWDYYDYTADKKYLRDVCYPVLRDMSIFLSKSLIEVDGKLLIENSASPEIEHGGGYYHTKGCAFDQQMVYENYKRTLQAAEILGVHEPIIDTIKEQIGRLDPVIVGASGQVKEFREENNYGDIGEYNHRHVSQLVGMYPGTLINANTPEWLSAAQVTLTERGDKSTGWAAAHRLCLWTRAKNGKKAMDLVRSMMHNNILPNLWDNHPPFQIDGNFGYTAGVCEMLLQSQAGYIELLQALPDEWSDGSFSGLVARGNFVVDCEWQKKMPTRVKILSRAGGMLSIRERGISDAEVLLNCKKCDTGCYENEILSIQTNIGDILEIRFK